MLEFAEPRDHHVHEICVIEVLHGLRVNDGVLRLGQLLLEPPAREIGLRLGLDDAERRGVRVAAHVKTHGKPPETDRLIHGDRRVSRGRQDERSVFAFDDLRGQGLSPCCRSRGTGCPMK